MLTHATLQDDTLPLYFRIKALIILAWPLYSWNDGEAPRLEAEKLWSECRRLHPKGVSKLADTALLELRKELYKLWNYQRAFRPIPDDEFEAVFGPDATAEERAEEAAVPKEPTALETVLNCDRMELVDEPEDEEVVKTWKVLSQDPFPALRASVMTLPLRFKESDVAAVSKMQ